VLTTAYHTLLSAVLLSWTPKHPITLNAFVTFVRSVLDGLPSTSTASSTTSSNASIFGELLADIIWSIDAELEEITGDARIALSQCSEQNKAKEGKEKDRATILAKVTKAKQNADADKDSLVELVQKFLVCHTRTPAPSLS
jgi:THO complex subunit 2